MFSTAVRYVSTIRWSSKLSNPYAGNPDRKKQIEDLVKNHAKNKGLDDRGAETAVILYDQFIVYRSLW